MRKEDEDGAELEYNVSKLVDTISQILNAANVAAKANPACEFGGVSLSGQLKAKDFKRCCEDSDELVLGTIITGELVLEADAFECLIPLPIPIPIPGVTVRALLKTEAKARLAAGEQSDPCLEGSCQEVFEGSVELEAAGGLAVVALTPEILQIRGGLQLQGGLTFSYECGAFDVDGMVGPAQWFAEVTALQGFKEKISGDLPFLKFP